MMTKKWTASFLVISMVAAIQGCGGAEVPVVEERATVPDPVRQGFLKTFAIGVSGAIVNQRLALIRPSPNTLRINVLGGPDTPAMTSVGRSVRPGNTGWALYLSLYAPTQEMLDQINITDMQMMGAFEFATAVRPEAPLELQINLIWPANLSEALRRLGNYNCGEEFVPAQNKYRLLGLCLQDLFVLLPSVMPEGITQVAITDQEPIPLGEIQPMIDTLDFANQRPSQP